jgi:repressor LexA
VKVVGDALKDVQIAAGDSLIVQRQSTASAGQMVLAKLPDEGTQLVYWMPESNRVRLQPIDRNASAKFVERAEVIGVVVGLFRQFA